MRHCPAMGFNQATIRLRATLLVVILVATAVIASASVWHAYNKTPGSSYPQRTDVRLPRA
jgi:hypothetical protein